MTVWSFNISTFFAPSRIHSMPLRRIPFRTPRYPRHTEINNRSNAHNLEIQIKKSMWLFRHMNEARREQHG